MGNDLKNTFAKLANGASRQQPEFLEFDASEYAAELSGLDISKDQELELLETLWSIMYSFVELGFDVDISNVFISDDKPDRLELADTPNVEMPIDSDGKESAT